MLSKIASLFSFKPAVPEPIEIKFEDLAQLWLRYNEGFVPQEAEPEVFDVSGVAELSQPAPQPAAPASMPLPVPALPAKRPEVPIVSPKDTGAPKFDSNIFYQDLIEPYKNQFLIQEAFNGVGKILELLDKHGNCPSIVITATNKDSETDDIYSIKNILLKVTLKEHSFRVARIAVKLLKDQYRDYETLIPKTVTAAIGHDIGKIPALRESGLYSKTDHPLVSASKVAELFDGRDIFWLNSVLDAIKNHHRASDDQFATLIRQADSKAREIEVAEVSKELSVKDWAEWFNVDRILEMARPQVNVIQTGNLWQAFSFGGTVYCQQDFIYELTKKLATESKIIDMTITRISEKEVALRKVVNSLRQKDYLACEIGEGYCGRNFDITLEKFKKKFYLIPIKIEAFGVLPHEIENVKDAYLRTIKDVNFSKR